ncbi:2-dehydropantoate 2-reductase [Skermania sp. ID1734]|uniref:2-dehydropantoate 2-reductase n=1 Tax=Skermania sp. ID1734 TaxID=2597516 RepID=UPI00117DA21F|nr:2-dehydropantoate 2-reductase [Skermania sp. ID1734]TSE01648.1 2-dehydropantoate 2-reductase [Skermania sp. ID1734]
MTDKIRICIFGAGSIGCYVGGRLAATDAAEVSFIARERIATELRAHGLHLSDLHGTRVDVPPERFDVDTAPTAAATADFVFVTVKSAATEAAGKTLAELVQPGTVVISLQNGIGNADVLRTHLPTATVLAGMVMYNVVHHGDGRFHQGSDGDIEISDHPRLDALAPVFDAAGLQLVRQTELLPVQWAKLILNLNNAVNALSGLPLREELSQRDYRCCVSLAQREAFAVLDRAGIQPARLTPVPPALMPRLLTVPDFVFTRVFGQVIAIDPLARSSMADDLDAGRRTEIDWLSGEIVRLGERVGVPTPVNARLIELIRQAESGERRTWTGRELLAELRSEPRSPIRSVASNVSRFGRKLWAR